MNTPMKIWRSSLLLLFGFALTGAEHLVPESELLTHLKRGGYILYLRHGKTEASEVDRNLSRPSRCRDQRNLSSEGRRASVQLGERLREEGIPIGEVLASPICRTMDTARFAFRRVTAETRLLDPEAVRGVRGGSEREFTELFFRQPTPGTNTVYLSHQPTFKKLTGIELSEGEGAVIDPKISRAKGRVVALGRFKYP